MITPYYADDQVTLWHGDAVAVLADLPSGSVDCCVTSPPYCGLRDYGQAGQYGHLDLSLRTRLAQTALVEGEAS